MDKTAPAPASIRLVVRFLVIAGLLTVVYSPGAPVAPAALLPAGLAVLALALSIAESRGTHPWAPPARFAADLFALAGIVILLGLHPSGRAADLYLVVLTVVLIGAESPGLAGPLAAGAVAAGAQAMAAYAGGGLSEIADAPFLFRTAFLAGSAILLGFLAHEAGRERRSLHASRRALSARVADLSGYLDAILQNVQTGVLVVQSDGTVALCNRRGAELLGLPPGGLADRPLREAPWLAPLSRLLETAPAEMDRPELALARPDGTTVELGLGLSPLAAAEGRPAGTIVVFQDITPIKDYQRRLLRQERLAAAGRIAGGVAHEFGNLLGGLRTHAEFALGNGRPEEMREALEVVAANIDRALLIVRNLLSFSRPAPPRPEPCDAGRVLDGALALLAHDFRHQKIEVIRSISDGLRIQADPAQTQQVFVNILLNARHALPGGGTLRVTASRDGNRVRIAFADSGPGIPPEVRPHLFEPFFTTRTGDSTTPPGSGLGLAISRDIVRGHGGEIEVESESGKGATFIVTFPAAGEHPGMPH